MSSFVSSAPNNPNHLRWCLTSSSVGRRQKSSTHLATSFLSHYSVINEAMLILLMKPLGSNMDLQIRSLRPSLWTLTLTEESRCSSPENIPPVQKHSEQTQAQHVHVSWSIFKCLHGNNERIPPQHHLLSVFSVYCKTRLVPQV